MLRRSIKTLLGHLGYELQRLDVPIREQVGSRNVGVVPVAPVWPLPRGGEAWSNDEIKESFGRYELWHYAYDFEGGLSFGVRHKHATKDSDARERPLQRFRHFMPYVLGFNNSSLVGKRVLDIACNSGFWSIQCALHGADVIGFDAREELVSQANLIKSITGVANVEFRQLDFWEMTPETLGGKFDIVLNLGILYHLADPLEALRRTVAMSSKHIIVDTGIYPSNNAMIKLQWEEPIDIRDACNAGIVAFPSGRAVELMFKHLGAAEWFRIPTEGKDMPDDYLNGSRATWFVTV